MSLVIIWYQWSTLTHHHLQEFEALINASTSTLKPDLPITGQLPVGGEQAPGPVVKVEEEEVVVEESSAVQDHDDETDTIAGTLTPGFAGELTRDHPWHK